MNVAASPRADALKYVAVMIIVAFVVLYGFGQLVSLFDPAASGSQPERWLT